MARHVDARARRIDEAVDVFLLGDTLVARCDLKADRGRHVLIVQSAFLEAGQNARRVAAALIDELHSMRQWLELERIEIAQRGDPSNALRRAAKPSGSLAARRRSLPLS